MTDSTLASLASRTDTKTVTATSDKSAQTKQITGQYLLTSFVSSKNESTKLDIIRTAVANVDTASMKTALDDMVKMAAKIDIANGVAEKDVTKIGATYRAAANSRSIIQKVYGALRFASDEMNNAGFVDTMGYHTVSVLAKKALTAKAITWTGETGLNEEQKAQKAQHRAEDTALRLVQKEHPRNANESLVQYQHRTLELVRTKIESLQAQAEQEEIDKHVQALISLGSDKAKAIAEQVLLALEPATA